MSELLPLLKTVVEEADAGRPPALCAVLKTKGSTPQSPGAMLVVKSDYSTLGTLGGGCVEAEVRRRAFDILQKGESALLDFVLDHDYGWDDGLICGGKMTIGVAPLKPESIDAIRAAVVTADQRKPASFPLTVTVDGATQTYRIHLEIPPTLIIAGAGHVGCAVARWAVDLDFHVVVIDDRAEFASPDRFDPRVELTVADIPEALGRIDLDDGSYVVIVTRGHKHDHQALQAVIDRGAGYVGLIGSKRKARMILADLAQAGVSPEAIERVRTPIGLPINAVTVPEIAVSILAELVQQRRNRRWPLVEGPL